LPFDAPAAAAIAIQAVAEFESFGRNMKAKQFYLTSTAIWALLCVAHYVFRTHSILAGPRDDDLYAFSWGFQSIMFLLFRFPLWCVVLATVLLAGSWHFSRSKKNQKAEQGVRANPSEPVGTISSSTSPSAQSDDSS
jgi:hypothetical protein